MKSLTIIGIFFLSLSLEFLGKVNGQTDPVIRNWKKTTGTGYGGYANNVLSVKYSSNYVYVKSNSIPSYSVGPWSSNPNLPTAQGYTFKFPRYPTSASTKVSTMLGPIGIWTDGVAAFNADDGQSYLRQGVWKRNAYVFEGISFDPCNGHPAPGGCYHTHINPSCLYSSISSAHSPLIGFAFDGYPIYGPNGYSSAMDSSSFPRRMTSSYRTRNISARTTLANGTVLSSSLYGPTVSATWPLGSFLDDFEYVKGLGDLDEHNGRFCVTPEYPTGTYAYFITLDASSKPAYPFIIGPKYYGNVVRENIGPTGGKVTITETVTTYF